MKINFSLNARSLAIQTFLLLAVFIFGIFPLIVSGNVINSTALSDQNTRIQYTEEQLQDIVGPSVVRVIQHVEGTAQIAPIVVSIKDRTVFLDDTKEPVVFDMVDSYIIGNGFIINSEGYILTNAHFVSDVTSRLAIVTSYVEAVVKEAEDIESESIGEDVAFGIEILDLVIENSTFELEKEIVVLNPEVQIDGTGEDLSFDIDKIGIPANILYVDDHFYKGGENLAIIEIKNKNLPAVLISDENVIVLGDRFYAFDTPGVYDFESTNDLYMKESSVVVSKTGTDVLYTDMDLYPAASGGPFFNAAGDIVGILAFEGQRGGSGDKPVQALIIPNDIIQTTLDKTGILNNEGLYVAHFKKGVEYIDSGRCDEASSEFEKALLTGSPFIKETALDLHLIECYKASELLSEPQTGISGLLDMIQKRSASSDLLDWTIIVLAALLALTLLVVFIMMIRRFRKKEDQFYKPSEHARSEEVQVARRAPLSKALPKTLKETPARTVGKDVVVSSLNNVHINKTTKAAEVPTGGGRTPGDPSSVSPELLRMIPKQDQKQLAELWPDKYGNRPQKSETASRAEVIKTVTGADTGLIDYIKETRSLGFSDMDIRRELGYSEWSAEDIDAAFDEIVKKK